MRGVSKKMLISILTSVIVMVTMVATTFAWVGIFTYANTDNATSNGRINAGVATVPPENAGRKDRRDPSDWPCGKATSSG